MSRLHAFKLCHDHGYGIEKEAGAMNAPWATNQSGKVNGMLPLIENYKNNSGGTYESSRHHDPGREIM
jgi:hypothetical protein